MSLIDRLLAAAQNDGRAIDVRVGTHWTIVVVQTPEGARAGLASTQVVHGMEHGQPMVRDAGKLVGKMGSELASWMRAASPTERSIGFAALNSLIQPDLDRCAPVNAEALILEKGRGKHVTIVGHFPFVPRVREVASACSVLELNPGPGDLPASAAPEVLPKADIVAITGMSLVNGTFEELAALCSPKAFVLLLGATTPLTPALFDYGIDAISGTVVDDIAVATAAVSQGANFRQIGGKRLLTMLKAEW